MWLELLAVSLWGGIVSADTTAALQIMISHPLISCAVVGIILGNFPLGFTIGILLELVWLHEIPAGSASFSEGNVGATVAAALAIVTAQKTGRIIPAVAISLLMAIIVSMIAGRMVIWMRTLNNKVYNEVINAQAITVRQVECAHIKGIFLAFFLGFFTTGISILILVPFLMPRVVSIIPVSMDHVLEPISIAFLGVGCGVLLFLFKEHKMWWLVFVGLIGGFIAYFIL
ncbi:MAG: hypothetical protein GWP06_07175 [Actinobacteria bacterium]|nr:hypothetical protein [Actinomycetota bacterium]